jgi:Methyltransferase domain
MDTFELWKLYKNGVEKEIEGWFYDHDLITFWLIDFIQKEAGWRGDLCELGVYLGKSAVALGAMARPDECLFCFDLFHEAPQHVTEANINRFCPDLGDRLVCIKKNLMALQAPPPEVGSNSLRFLHLDAVHDHPSVLNDLRNFSPLLTREAVIVLDDCFDPEWPGVPTAMAEFCLSDMGRHIRPFAASKSKMYLCARPYVEIYQRCIVASGYIDNLSFERVLDVSVLRCYTNFPVPRENLLRILDAGDTAP